ncbi:MAG: hypothetical protein RL122_2022 [Pseudomonadota bacterium]|jgi:hypothetical protein
MAAWGTLIQVKGVAVIAMQWIHEQPDWPRFSFQMEANLNALTNDVVKSSAIDGDLCRITGTLGACPSACGV